MMVLWYIFAMLFEMFSVTPIMIEDPLRDFSTLAKFESSAFLPVETPRNRRDCNSC
jgi:hypothetical protein